MVLDGESVPSQVRNSITADIAEVNNKIQVFYPLGAAGTVPTSTGSGSVTWEPKNQFGINISFDNGSFDYEIDASLQTADRTATLPDRDGTFAFSADSFSGIDFGSISGNPSAVQNGQAWYDTAVNQFKFRQNAATIALSTMAGQDASNVSITGGSVSGLSSLSAGTITASTSATVTANTASTSTTTGALVVTGGVGVGGAVFAGANSSFNGVPVGRGGSASGSVVAIGANAGSALSGAGCTFVGVNAGRFNTSADNTAYGSSACESNPGGANNSVFGSNSGRLISSGSGNTILGAYAARYISGGVTNCSSATNSIFVGNNAFPLANSQTNQIVIGTGAVGDGSDTTVIGTASTTQSRLFGGNSLTTGANGQSTQLGQSTTASPTPTTSGATVTVAGLIPANSIVIGVTARVTTAITGATSFDIGDGTTANLFGDDVAVALNTTSNNTIAPTRYATATNVVLTANGGNFTAGAVRLTVHFLTLVAPTS